MCELLEPASQNGGTYANKPGSHNIGNNLPDHGEGNLRTDHSIRHAWNRTGPWWRTKTAGRDWTFPDAQRGDYTTINKYTRRIINAMRDPNDTRTDDCLFYVLGNTDGDVQTEGYDEIDNGNESSGDDTHAWHIHESWQRRAVGLFDRMWKVLTVYMGWTFAEWQRSVTEEDDVSEEEVKQGFAELLVEMVEDRATSQRGRLAAQRLEKLLVNPVVTSFTKSLAAFDAVDEVALAQALAPALADAVLAKLPDSTDPVTKEELVEALTETFRQAFPQAEAPVE
jgi:hypothetical protein